MGRENMIKFVQYLSKYLYNKDVFFHYGAFQS